MKKRIIALILCLAATVSVLAGCAGSIDADSEFKGQQLTMYMSENLYNLDPAYAYKNDSTKAIVGLLFDTLFTLDANGEVQPSLAKSYKTEKTDEGYFMYIEINSEAYWSDRQVVTAADVVYAWERILNPNNAYDCASLLFDIKNARAYNEGDVSKEDVGIEADKQHLTIQFEKKTDYDQFLLNLTSLALAPLRQDIASKNEDWAKKPGIMATSGPFKLSKVGFYKNGEVEYEDINYSVKKVDKNNKVETDTAHNPIYIEATEPDSFAEQRINSFILERNLYYYRNAEDGEKLDVSVTPYRIVVDCSLSDKDIIEAYNKGIITYIGDIPMSLRNSEAVKNMNVVTYSSLSTNSIYLNSNAEVTRTTADGEEKVKLFDNVVVRQALSMAVNREDIVKKIVYADVATGLVPNGIFNTDSPKEQFRDKAGETSDYLSYNLKEASRLLKEVAKIVPSEYSFSITVASYDEEHMAIAEIVADAWTELGFKVTLNTRGTIANNDYHKDVAGIPSDLCDDLWAEDLAAGKFEAILLDVVAPTASAFSILSPFAKKFSGQAMDMSNVENYRLTPHPTGYDSRDYNLLIERAFREKDLTAKAELLHDAEECLMKDLPLIPLVFNKSVYVINDDILDLNNKFLFWETSSDYYLPVVFDKMSVKNYDDYELNCANYVYENFEEWKKNPKSYFGVNFPEMTKEAFAYTNSNYYYLFKDKFGTKGYDWLNEKPQKETESAAQKEPEETTEKGK